MAIKPILFNTEMVRAILDGRKTCTRRLGRWKIAKLNADKNGNVTATVFEETKKGKTVSHFMGGSINEFIKVFSNYQPGDILYVRETWYKDKYRYMYCANYSDSEKFYCDGKEIKIKWHPSIHMPKEAARIWLKVTNVRAERLQKITNDEAVKEGIYVSNCKDCSAPFGCDTCPDEGYNEIDEFAELWDSTIKKSDFDRYGWDANPYVWIIEFERREKPEGV